MKKILKRIKWIFLVIVLFIAGIYVYEQYQKYEAEKLAAEAVIEVACVGDSLTFGRSYTEEIYTYPGFLEEMLGSGYKLTNYGMGGTCVQEDLAYPYSSTRVYRASIKAEPDVLIIMLGSNDIWEPGWRDEETFYNYYTKLIDSYLQTENKPKIYLCTIPYIYMEQSNDVEMSYNEIGERYTNVIRRVAQEREYYIIEMRQASLERPEWYGDDGLHFNKEGAYGVAQKVYDAIRNSRGLEAENEE